MTADVWYEGFTPGTLLRSGPRTVLAADIDRFAALTGDRHPVHMDDAFARAAGFRQRIAHGLFGLALMEGLKAGIGGFERSVTASLGWDAVRFHAPLEPGDTVLLELEYLSRRPSSRPGLGVAVERARLLRADGTELTTGRHAVLLRMAPRGGGDAAE